MRAPVRATLAATLAATLSLGTAARARADEPPRATAALDAVARHGVLVSVRFQKDLEADARGAVAPDPDAATEVYRRWRMSLRVPGFVVRDRRTVVLADLFVAPGSIRGIELEGADGAKVAGRLTAFLPRTGGVVVTAEQDLAVEPIALPAAGSATGPTAPLPDGWFVGTLAEHGTTIEATAERLRDEDLRHRPLAGGPVALGRPHRPTAGLAGASSTRGAELLVAADGALVGLRLDGSGIAPTSRCRLDALAEELAHAVPFATLADRRVAAPAEAKIHGVRLTYRPATADDDPSGLAALMTSTPPPEPDPDARFWGVAITPDTLLVPATLPPSWVTRLVKVTVEEEGGVSHEARYEGRVANLGAFVVRLVDAKVEPLPDDRPPPPAAHAAFLVHRTAWRAGARRDGLAYDRSLGTTRGYADRAYLATEGTIEAGTFLLDLEGRFLGFSADLTPDDVERIPGRAGSDDGQRGVVAALFADLGAPATLAANLDRRVTPTSSRAPRRLVWLGVEAEPLRGPAVAEALDVAGPTRDGARGLVVNVVYPGSPAERAGLKVDDLLLSARRTSGPGSDAPPVDLRDAPTASDWPDGSEVPRPWTPRMNALVRLLESWGEGTTYVLEVLRDDAIVEVAATVEGGPADVSSAEQAYDAETGLAVKELTYEVRHGLRLAKETTGVLVASIDDGSPAAQAKVLAYEVILEIDGKPIDGPKGFARGIVEARMNGKREIRMVVLRLDRTRFVDLRVAATPAGAPPVPR